MVTIGFVLTGKGKKMSEIEVPIIIPIIVIILSSISLTISIYNIWRLKK